MTIDPLLNDTGLGMSFDATFPPFSQPPLPTKSVASDERMRSATNSQNPLSLLAEASHGAQTPLFGTFSLPAQPSPHLIIREDTPMMGLRVKREVLQEGLKTIMSMPGDGLTGQPRDYFANQQTDHRDLGETLDPCDIGLLDEADLPRLFAAFYDDAHQCGPTLDPALHTPAYVRSHSALLLTTIALLAAQSTPGEALLTKRLHRHALFLRKEIYLRNYRSIEIIQALNLMAIWPRTGASSADDQSGLALAQSTAIALELGLERNVEAKKGPSGMTLESDVEAQRHQRCVHVFPSWHVYLIWRTEIERGRRSRCTSGIERLRRRRGGAGRCRTASCVASCFLCALVTIKHSCSPRSRDGSDIRLRFRPTRCSSTTLSCASSRCVF